MLFIWGKTPHLGGASHLSISSVDTFRGSQPEVFCQKVVLKYFSKFTGKSLSWSLLFESCKLKAGRFIWVCMSIFKYIPVIFTVYTAWKVSKCRGFSSPYFPLSELNTEIYGVNLFISVQIQEKTDQKKLHIFFA